MPSGPMSFERLMVHTPLRLRSEILKWESTLVIAPHPDDESLGCGGVIALLRQHQQPVQVLFISDGSMSHPHSQHYPAEARRDLREQEAREALKILGVSPQTSTFLRLPDTQVPLPPLAQGAGVPASSGERFDEAVAAIRYHLQRIKPRTLLVPWRRDPHGDHRATWHLLRAAVARLDLAIRWLEYPIWVWESVQAEDLPTVMDGEWFKVDITEVLPQKRRAIAAHVSQTTSLIDDDPNGFMLSAAMIDHFTQPYEFYLSP